MRRNAAKDVRNDPGAFRRKVRVPAMQVAGLTPEELSTALAYEVESASGVPAAEADIAWTSVVDPDPEMRAYDVAVRRKTASAASFGAEKVLKLLMFGAFALVAALVADFAYLTLRTRSVEKELAERAPLDAEIKSIDRRAKANRDEAARLRLARAQKEAAHFRVAALRRAHPALMDALANASGGRMVVREISPAGPFAVEMRAAAATAEDCAHSLSALTRAARSAGWRAWPGDITPGEGGMSVFSCRFAFDAAAASGKVGR